MKIQSSKITASLVRGCIVPRPKDSNKGTYGHVLVLAGSAGLTGAAALCAHGALRAGAGLVTVGMPESRQAAVIARLRPEAMTLALPEESGMLGMASFTMIRDFVEARKVTSIVMGPGLGNTEAVYALVRQMLSWSVVPLVLDADAINVLMRERRGGCHVPSLKAPKGPVVVTPHPGELSRITGRSVRDIQADRTGAVTGFSADHNVVCLLKGAGTLVARGTDTLINTTGNPGMASGGTGDVLSGMIGALVMQVREPRHFNAALCGVYLHGLAGDLAAKKRGQTGLLAGDVAEMAPKAVDRIMKGK